MPVILGALALLVGMAPGNGGGGNAGCSQGVASDVPAASTPGTAVPVTTGANVVCVTPESGGGGSFGPPGKQTFQTGGTPGQPCTAVVWEPLELTLSPGGQMLIFWPDPSFNGNGSTTPEPQDLARIIAENPKTFFEQAGTTDFFMPFTLNGKWDASGSNCVPKDPNDPQASFQEICNTVPIALACLGQTGHPITGTPPGIGAPGLINLRNQIVQLIRPGTITTLPAQPAPGVVNLPTCFFIDGANIAGQDVNQEQDFQMVLLGPPDASGRQVFFIYLVQLQKTGVTWDFGDGSSDPTPGLDPQCLGRSNAPLQFSHTYLRYSPPAGFAVTAHETFSLNVTVFWDDSNGQPNTETLPPLPGIDVQPGPAAGFSKVIVQEEGVPVTAP
jgi:hypothetical protein